MGKKGSWFSALFRAFTSSSKEKQLNVQGPEKVHVKEKKKWGFGKSRNGEINSFIPLYREPSSIEKILGDAEREQHQKLHHQLQPRDNEREQRQKIHHVPPIDSKREERPKIHQVPPLDSEREKHKKVEHLLLRDVERAAQREQHQIQRLPPREAEREVYQKKIQVPPEKVHRSKKPKSKLVISSKNAQTSATKIQAAYRGHMARKSYRALKGLMRLQSVMRGQSVRRQTMNAMRCMQMFVRVQSQVRSMRLQTMESRNAQHHLASGKSEKDIEGSLSRWNFVHHQPGAGVNEDWDDSMLPKEEIDARMRRKVEAVIKRERALAYAYSHQLLKVTPLSAQAVLSDIKSGGFPWWWNWLERQLPPPQPNNQPPTSRPPTAQPATPNHRPNKKTTSGIIHIDASTPRSSKPSKPKHPGISSNRWQAQALRDDESLTSCPAYTVPNYMAPTVSAKAKVRDTPPVTGDGKRGFSFALSQSIGSLKWSKGSVFGAKDAEAKKKVGGRHRSIQSIGDLSVDSTISLPVGVGRKPFR